MIILYSISIFIISYILVLLFYISIRLCIRLYNKYIKQVYKGNSNKEAYTGSQGAREAVYNIIH